MMSSQRLQYLTEKYDIGNVPGYLSYPAVAKWKRPITEQEVLGTFERELGSSSDAYLYFHFPYCQTLCYYCACYMKVTADPKTRYDDYIRALDRELEMKIDRVRSERVHAGQMHWGGGTPTYMSCEQIERAFQCIDRRVKWAPGAELSIEAYPDARTLSEEKIELLARLGFTQISFGIESLDPKVLEAINRKHDIESIRYWVDKARSAGFGVHVDLVYGLPYQTAESFRDTVEQVLSIRPDRLATFSFMYTPISIKHQRAIPRASVPTSLERFRLYEALQEMVSDTGYTRVGCDHWVQGDKDPLAVAAKQGDIIYHFQGYEPLSRQTFLGFGSSAVTFAQGRYFQNLHSVNDYQAALDAGKLPTIAETSAVLSEDDRVRHRVIMKHVMSDLRVGKDAVEKEFGLIFDDYFADSLELLRDMERDELIEGVDSRVIRVLPLGRTFIRNIAHTFDRYFLVPKTGAAAGGTRG
jgi:oxygen-independent coproporphyrinogen-3 oxidase